MVEHRFKKTIRWKCDSLYYTSGCAMHINKADVLLLQDVNIPSHYGKNNQLVLLPFLSSIRKMECKCILLWGRFED